MTSRQFISYEECVSACKALMDDVVKGLNSSNPVFKLSAEVNPMYTGQVTLSKDWGPGEISRLWIYDQGMEKTGHIHAVGQARIFGSTYSVPSQLS